MNTAPNTEVLPTDVFAARLNISSRPTIPTSFAPKDQDRERATKLVYDAFVTMSPRIDDVLRDCRDYMNTSPRDPYFAARFTHWVILLDGKRFLSVMGPLSTAVSKPNSPLLLRILYAQALLDSSDTEKALKVADQVISALIEYTTSPPGLSAPLAELDTLVDMKWMVDRAVFLLYSIGGRGAEGEELVEKVIDKHSTAVIRRTNELVAVVEKARISAAIAEQQRSASASGGSSRLGEVNDDPSAAIQRLLDTTELLRGALRLYPFAHYSPAVCRQAIMGLYAYVMNTGATSATGLLLNATVEARNRWRSDVVLACYRIASLRFVYSRSATMTERHASSQILVAYYDVRASADMMENSQVAEMFHSECVVKAVTWAFSVLDSPLMTMTYVQTVLLYRIGAAVTAVHDLCATALTNVTVECGRLDDAIAADHTIFSGELKTKQKRATAVHRAVVDAVEAITAATNSYSPGGDLRSWARRYLGIVRTSCAPILATVPQEAAHSASMKVHGIADALAVIGSIEDLYGDKAYVDCSEEPEYDPTP